jgi:hypothetical protein
MTLDQNQVPRVGMLATVRNRRGVISAVEPYAASKTSELLHLVTIEFSDSDGDPEEQLLWERERQPVVLEPNALPRVDVDAPMRMHEFLALQRATRWTAITPFISAENPECQAEPVPTAPVYGAVSADDFQLVPLARAMRMPRVSLLLADDVGLGKTVEAGLILTELVRKRRIRRVLIITPASLRTQWQQEMEEKFSLGFDIVDKASTHRLQKEMGLDANPWRVLPRIITSYHYLRQPDVLEQFIANCRSTQAHQGAQLPWDLLIVAKLGTMLPYAGPHAGSQASTEDPGGAEAAREVWDEIDTDVKAWLTNYRVRLTTTLAKELKTAGEVATEHESAAFERRIREVAALQREQSVETIKREIEERRTAQLQYSLLEDVSERAERELRDLHDELKRRQGQFGGLLERLKDERDRILKNVMPHRFALLGSAQVFPVTIEIRLPGRSV